MQEVIKRRVNLFEEANEDKKLIMNYPAASGRGFHLLFITSENQNGFPTPPLSRKPHPKGMGNINDLNSNYRVFFYLYIRHIFSDHLSSPASREPRFTMKRGEYMIRKNRRRDAEVDFSLPSCCKHLARCR